jgi:mRNA-degrading endonuclease RelE of RelBE toxin-antitoxin system
VEPYRVVVETDVTTLVALLSETDQEYILVDLAISLGRAPHEHGEVWMTFGAEIWRVVQVGTARLAFVVDDGARTVTIVSLTLAER